MKNWDHDGHILAAALFDTYQPTLTVRSSSCQKSQEFAQLHPARHFLPLTVERLCPVLNKTLKPLFLDFDTDKFDLILHLMDDGEKVAFKQVGVEHVGKVKG